VANLIIKSDYNDVPDEVLRHFKNRVNVTNWRAIGELDDGMFFVTTEQLENYIISNFTIKKFHETVRLNLNLPVNGRYVGSSLICPECLGTGITDWVSNIVKSKPRLYNIPSEFEYSRDKNIIHEADMSHGDKLFKGYFSVAEIPEAHEHCKFCKGNGTYHFGRTMKNKDSPPVIGDYYGI
jgi:hypothetical protein